MFGMGFTEILLIAVIAILFLGPDKLPSALVDIAKFFRQVKSTISDAKNSIEEELHVSDIQQEVLNYKKELLDASNDLKKSTHIDELGNLDKLVDIDEIAAPKEPQKSEEVTFKKKKNQKKTEEVESKEVEKVKKEDTDV